LDFRYGSRSSSFSRSSSLSTRSSSAFDDDSSYDPTPGGQWCEDSKQHWIELDTNRHGGTLFAELLRKSSNREGVEIEIPEKFAYKRASVRFAIGDEFKNEDGRFVRTKRGDIADFLRGLEQRVDDGLLEMMSYDQASSIGLFVVTNGLSNAVLNQFKPRAQEAEYAVQLKGKKSYVQIDGEGYRVDRPKHVQISHNGKVVMLRNGAESMLSAQSKRR
jgi:hypothetical protein